jgi:hypothetical protein
MVVQSPDVILDSLYRGWASSMQWKGSPGPVGSGIIAPFPLAGEQGAEVLWCRPRERASLV